MLFGVGVLDGQGSPAPNGLPRSVKLSVVVLPGRSTLVATSMPPPQPTVLADKLADDVVAAAVARTPYGARILGASVSLTRLYNVYKGSQIYPSSQTIPFKLNPINARGHT